MLTVGLGLGSGLETHADCGPNNVIPVTIAGRIGHPSGPRRCEGLVLGLGLGLRLPTRLGLGFGGPRRCEG